MRNPFVIPHGYNEIMDYLSPLLEKPKFMDMISDNGKKEDMCEIKIKPTFKNNINYAEPVFKIESDWELTFSMDSILNDFLKDLYEHIEEELIRAIEENYDGYLFYTYGIENNETKFSKAIKYSIWRDNCFTARDIPTGQMVNRIDMQEVKKVMANKRNFNKGGYRRIAKNTGRI